MLNFINSWLASVNHRRDMRKLEKQQRRIAARLQTIYDTRSELAKEEERILTASGRLGTRIVEQACESRREIRRLAA